MKKRPKLPVKLLLKLVVIHHHLVSMNDSMYSPESLYTHIRICYLPYLEPKQRKDKRSPSLRGRDRGKGRGEKTTRLKSLQSGVFKQPICFPLTLYILLYISRHYHHYNSSQWSMPRRGTVPPFSPQSTYLETFSVLNVPCGIKTVKDGMFLVDKYTFL